MQSNIINRWKSGDSVVLRGVWHHTFWWACSATIVQDTLDLLALYWRAGTPKMVPAKRPLPQDLLTNKISLIAQTWMETDVLMLVTPEAAHAVYVMWETGQTKLRCWYIDLQEPLRRTEIGFDTMDRLLDIVISADRSEWHWKDEDEFEEAVVLGVYSPEEAWAIRAEGERVIRIFQAKQSPFCDGWEQWSPPAAWEIPSLPEGWDKFSTD
jgi:predicted RNA-binding protein associated with RNAse of E/G family